jgi:hypothetical protein
MSLTANDGNDEEPIDEESPAMREELCVPRRKGGSRRAELIGMAMILKIVDHSRRIGATDQRKH